ncbi:hypothetical protein SADUNF_Sadunf18G0022500 [Salix dunnii]|uniref:Uncharacterized protein n=1 Tax=Salix dunnii TaxID=1413687 RepID=A0A835J2W3_9ROSI|nr:hypothetical protein SADUNF_Sadunf18G0022500 [Salix dunnii]
MYLLTAKGWKGTEITPIGMPSPPNDVWKFGKGHRKISQSKEDSSCDPEIYQACDGNGDLNLGKVRGLVVKFGFGDEVNVQNTLVRRSSDAISLFREIQIEGVCPDKIIMVSV